jgi:uncharacterized membrane protein
MSSLFVDLLDNVLFSTLFHTLYKHLIDTNERRTYKFDFMNVVRMNECVMIFIESVLCFFFLTLIIVFLFSHLRRYEKTKKKESQQTFRTRRVFGDHYENGMRIMKNLRHSILLFHYTKRRNFLISKEDL